MPQVVDLGPEPPIGLCAESARPGQQVRVQTLGLAYPEDGTKLVSWLDQLISPVLAKLSPPRVPSRIDHLVAVIQRSGSAKVFVDEVQFIGEVKTKGSVKKGAPVYLDDIADSCHLKMQGVEVANDAGIIVMMSIGWRRAVFFDLGPIAGALRDYQLEAALGAFWGYLAFGDKVRVSDEQWAALLAASWFPFVGLKYSQLRSLLSHLDAGWDPDEVLPEIARDLKGRCAEVLALAEKVPTMAEHIGTLTAAVRHYLADDTLSTCGLLYPRIEGVLRGHAQQGPGEPNYTQKGLTSAVSIDLTGRRLPGSLLLPDRFKEFLEKVYFAPFNPESVRGVSRNSVSHGVAREAELNLKAATLALLVVEQLLHLSGREHV